MSQKYEAPTVKNEGISTMEKTYTHPAYGCVSLSRITCSPPQQLFGSHAKHSHFISLKIKRAERQSNGDFDFIFGRNELIEIYLSGTQLGDLLTSMNVGERIPCTIVSKH